MLFLGLWPGMSIGEQKLEGHLFEKEHNNLKQIIKNKYFRVITSRNSFDYHIYQGQPRGYQYELVKKFTERLNTKYVKDNDLKIQFEMIPADYDQMIPMLKDGKAEMIAANLTITSERKEDVAFTKALQEISELIVTRSKLIKNDVFKKKLAIRKSSSYFEIISKWNKENPEKFFGVELIDEDLTPENILELISRGKYDYTLIDSNLFEVGKEVFSNLALSKTQPFANRKSELAIAVRKSNQELLSELNSFVPKVKKGSRLGNIIERKYFDDAILLKTQEIAEEGKISPYDELFKKYASKYGWDWKLLAALCFQESRFNQDIINRWGAIGLFQVKQMTADEPYVNIKHIRGKKNAENNIHAGVKYLTWIKDRYFKGLPERRKIRMALAAYNAGPTRVIKARKLARKMGLNPDIWFRNVELAMAKMRKAEPVNYVSEINKRYASYKLLFEN